jgi:hypothetical protein
MYLPVCYHYKIFTYIASLTNRKREQTNNINIMYVLSLYWKLQTVPEVYVIADANCFVHTILPTFFIIYSMNFLHLCCVMFQYNLINLAS